MGEATEMIKKILETRGRYLGQQHIATGEAAYTLGILLHTTKLLSQAKESFVFALKIYQFQLPPNHESTLDIQRYLAELASVPLASSQYLQADKTTRIDEEDAAAEHEEGSEKKAEGAKVENKDSVAKKADEGKGADLSASKPEKKEETKAAGAGDKQKEDDGGSKGVGIALEVMQAQEDKEQEKEKEAKEKEEREKKSK